MDRIHVQVLAHDAAWRPALDRDPAGTRALLRQRLANGQRDPDLAAVREGTELEKLSLDEPKDWLALWDEGGALLGR
jgi:hypothetical protein